MGLTKQYLRFEPANVFGVIGNSDCNITWAPAAESDSRNVSQCRLVATGACESVNVWNVFTGQLDMTLTGSDSEVTCLTVSVGRRLLATGHADGSVRLYSLTSADLKVTLRGHRAAVTCVAFDDAGMRLASGSKDTEIVVWDVVAECGLYRLKGHRGPITQLRFMRSSRCLVSSSKDSLLKFWHLDSQHCFKTLVGHLTEVWDFLLLANDTRLITGSGDNQLRVYSLQFLDASSASASISPSAVVGSSSGEVTRQTAVESSAGDMETEQQAELDDDASDFRYSRVGSILRQGTGRVLRLSIDPTERILSCHGADNTLELLLINSEEQSEKRRAKRLKKLRKTISECDETGANLTTVAPSDGVNIQDELCRLSSIRTPSKLRATTLQIINSETAKVAVLLANNSLLTYTIPLSKHQQLSEPAASVVAGEQAVSSLQLPGHRSDVRAMDFTSDGSVLVTASSEQLKMWNTQSGLCCGSVSCQPALSLRVVSGDRHVLVASRSGRLQLVSFAAAQLLEDVQAHETEVWSVDLQPERRGFATAGADKQVKFWQFEMVEVEDRKQLSFTHTRTLSLEDDCLCVKFSPDGRLVAVALLDSTVKVFFTDSLKLFLTLYGHRLPVTCMDISRDSTLIVTGSGDKNIKVWGLDFGDCHKSMFAHDDIVSGVQFLGRTHQVFSSGKDGLLKHWDLDRHERIVTLRGHCGQVTALAVSSDGKCVASASRDRSVRLWRRSEEPLVLEDERDQEREEADERLLASGPAHAVPGERDGETGRAGQKTAATERAAERLLEAIEICHQYKLERQQCPNQSPELHPLMMARECHTPDHFIVDVLTRVKASELEECLIVLPFDSVLSLLQLLSDSLERGQCVAPELVCRCVCLLLRIHHGQLVAGGSMSPALIRQLQQRVHGQVTRLRDMTGFNMAALQFIQQQLAERDQVKLFVDATSAVKQRRKKRKRAENAALGHAALLSL